MNQGRRKFLVVTGAVVSAAAMPFSVRSPTTAQIFVVPTSIAEIVTDVYVIAGDFVKEGAALFKLDTRTFEAQLYEAEMDREPE